MWPPKLGLLAIWLRAPPSSPELVEVAQSVSAAAPLITGDWVADLLRRGVSIEEYVEVVGIVGRVAAVDAFVWAIGANEEPLPCPWPGAPSREPNPEVQWWEVFVPTEPKDRAPFALSAVPAEADARRQLHGPMCLTDEQMQDLTYEGGPHTGADRVLGVWCFVYQ